MNPELCLYKALCSPALSPRSVCVLRSCPGDTAVAPGRGLVSEGGSQVTFLGDTEPRGLVGNSSVLYQAWTCPLCSSTLTEQLWVTEMWSPKERGGCAPGREAAPGRDPAPATLVLFDSTKPTENMLYADFLPSHLHHLQP